MDIPPRAIRETAPLVGFALEHTPVVSQDDEACTNFDARIMHRQVPAELRNWCVQQDASDDLLSHRLGVETSIIQSAWLTSRSPLVDPRASNTAASTTTETAAMRTRARPSFAAVSMDTLQKYRDLASNLRSRLESLILSERTPPRNTDKYYSHKPLKPLTSLSIDDTYTYGNTYPESSIESGVGSFEPSSLLSNNSSRSSSTITANHCCGFNSLGKCVKKAPSYDRTDNSSSAVIRTNGGLYSGAKHTRPIARGETVYTEIEILYAGGSGGIAVGVAEDDYSLDSMVGGKRKSMALHSEGKIVSNGKWSDVSTCLSYGTGDIVGLFVTHSKTGRIVMRTTVNGRFSGKITGESQGRNNVYVMASMLRQGARVQLRCCREEWCYSPFYSPSMGNPVCAPRTCTSGDKLKHRNESAGDYNTSAVLTP